MNLPLPEPATPPARRPRGRPTSDRFGTLFDGESESSDVPLEGPARIVDELTSRGYNVERAAVTLLAGADDPASAIDRTVEHAPEDALVLTEAHVRDALANGEASPDGPDETPTPDAEKPADDGGTPRPADPPFRLERTTQKDPTGAGVFQSKRRGPDRNPGRRRVPP